MALNNLDNVVWFKPGFLLTQHNTTRSKSHVPSLQHHDIATLAPEILLPILDHIDTRKLLMMRQTSSLFENLVNDAELWKHKVVNVKFPGRVVKTDYFKRLQSICLPNGTTPSEMETIAIACPVLKSIDMSMDGDMGPDAPQTNYETWRIITTGFKELVSVSIPSIEMSSDSVETVVTLGNNISSLQKLQCGFRAEHNDIGIVMSAMPNLLELCIAGPFCYIGSESSHNIVRTKLKIMIAGFYETDSGEYLHKWIPDIVTLSMGFEGTHPEKSVLGLENIGANCKSLRDLRVNNVCVQHIFAITTYCTALTKLSITYGRFSDESFSAIASSLVNLRSLDIAMTIGDRMPTCDDIATIAEKCQPGLVVCAQCVCTDTGFDRLKAVEARFRTIGALLHSNVTSLCMSRSREIFETLETADFSMLSSNNSIDSMCQVIIASNLTLEYIKLISCAPCEVLRTIKECRCQALKTVNFENSRACAVCILEAFDSCPNIQCMVMTAGITVNRGNLGLLRQIAERTKHCGHNQWPFIVSTPIC